MMDQYLNYLQNKQIIKPSQRPFYVQWVLDLYKYCKKKPGQELSQKEIESYVVRLTDTRQEWQVHQAEDAIRLYLYFLKQQDKGKVIKNSTTNAVWTQAVNQMINVMRLKHRSFRTEQTYLTWMRQFYRFVQGRTPETLETQHVIDFLTYLAVERKVAKSTQSQAFNAILFFFRHVLKKEVNDLSEAVRSKRKKRLPTVFSQEEAHRILQQMNGTTALMARLIYGSGLRSNECVRLRVKDLDFDRACVVVRSAKGDKDRETTFPQSLNDPLRKHLEEVEIVFNHNDLYPCGQKK